MADIRQNYHKESEGAINKQINMELHASYTYLAMAYSMDNTEVALPGFFKFFKNCSDEERTHAEKLMKYQNMRGGNIILQPINKPARDMYTDPLEATEAALQLEKQVNESLLGLHKIADNNNDYQMMDFIEGEYLKEQVEAQKELGDMIRNLKRCGSGLGVFEFDKTLQ